MRPSRGGGTRKISFLKLLILASVTAFAVAVMFIGVTAARVMQQARRDESRRAGAIVVFGAAEYAGKPSPVFRARLDHGLALWQRGAAPLVVVTGGGRDDPHYTEGGVGRDYLLRNGIPDRYLIAETLGRDTAQQAQRVAAILRTNAIRDCVAVSDAYHMYRIKQLMGSEGIRAYASPRPASIPRGTWAQVTSGFREGFSYLLWKLDLT